MAKRVVPGKDLLMSQKYGLLLQVISVQESPGSVPEARGGRVRHVRPGRQVQRDGDGDEPGQCQGVTRY